MNTSEQIFTFTLTASEVKIIQSAMKTYRAKWIEETCKSSAEGDQLMKSVNHYIYNKGVKIDENLDKQYKEQMKN